MSTRSHSIRSLLRFAVAQSRADLSRMVASGLAVVIGSAFVVVAMGLTASSNQAVLDAVAAQYSRSAAVASFADSPNKNVPGIARRLAEQTGAEVVIDRGGVLDVSRLDSGAGEGQSRPALSLSPPGPLRWERILTGRFPTRKGEVAVSGPSGLSIGDVIVTKRAVMGNVTPEALAQAKTRVLTVVGTIDIGSDPRRGVGTLFYVTDDQARALGLPPAQMRVAAAPGATASQTLDAVSAALTADAVTAAVQVTSGHEVAQKVARSYTGSTAGVTAGLLVFVVIALLVAALVIANTLSVVLAQRVRELALLRCVGASPRQVALLTVGEAAILGLVASVAGAGLGAGLTALVSTTLAHVSTSVPLGAVVIPTHALVLGVVAGTMTCVLAAFAPARAVSRVEPLAALRPAPTSAVKTRQGRVAVSAMLLFGGLALLLLVGGAEAGSLALAVIGGVVGLIPLVLLIQRAAGPMAGMLGRLMSPLGGVSVTLAAESVRRHPRRTAASALILMVGITLTAAVLVGGASTRATANADLESNYPIDVTIQTVQAQGLPASLLEHLTEVPGVSATAGLTEPVRGSLTVNLVTQTKPAIRHAKAAAPRSGVPVEAIGINPADARRVVRSESDLRLPISGQGVMSYRLADQIGVTDGTRMQLTGPTGDRVVTVVLGDNGVSASSVLLDDSDLALMAPTRVTGTWIRLQGGLDDGASQKALALVAASTMEASPGAQVTASVAEREGLGSILNALLIVVTALLAVSVLVGLLGLGNTLTLSAFERRKESAILRAVGMSRRQLGAAVTWEAVLVSALAAVFGCLLGIALGLIGTRAGLGALTPVVPWAQLGALACGALLAGAVASLLPAVRTTRGTVMSSLTVDR